MLTNQHTHNEESTCQKSTAHAWVRPTARTDEKIWPELETFNSHSTQQWSLAQQSDWQLIPNQWQFSDISFLLPLVCLLTQAEAWHSDKKLTKSPQRKMKNKNGIRYLDLIFSVRDCKVQEGKRAVVMEEYTRGRLEQIKRKRRKWEAFLSSLQSD